MFDLHNNESSTCKLALAKIIIKAKPHIYPEKLRIKKVSLLVRYVEFIIPTSITPIKPGILIFLNNQFINND